jgi:hypothetical protein
LAGKAALSGVPSAPIKVISAYASFDAEKGAIDALKQGWAQTPEAFAEKKAEMLADAKKRWGVGKKGAAAAPRVVLAADEVAWTLIDSGVDKEWELLKDHRAKSLLGSKLGYGHPFAPCTLPDETGKAVVYDACSNRFAFWPTNKTAMPLLYIAAITFLCNCKATSTSNESFHSVATYILRDSRRSMTNIKAEALTLMRAVLPDYLKKKYPELLAVEVAAKKDGYLDVAEVGRVMALSPDADPGADGDDMLTEAMAAASRVFDAGSEPELSDGEDSLIDLMSASSGNDEPGDD